MINAALITAIWSLAIGIAVLWVNPRRFANQALAILGMLWTAWSGLIYIGLHLQGNGRLDEASVCFLADNMVAAFIAWATWLLKEALACPEKPRTRILRSSAPWFGIGLATACIALLPGFIVPAHTAGAPLGRGAPYLAFIVIVLVTHGAIVLQCVRQLRVVTGIQRLEMQYLMLNITVSTFLTGALNGLGSFAHIPQLRLLGFPVALCMLALMGWAMTVHRIFDMRQVFVSVAQRIAVIAIVATAVLFALSSDLGRGAAAETVVLAAGLALGLWLDKRTRALLELDGRKTLDRLRRIAVEISRTEPSTESLVAAFEELLRKECRTDFAVLLWNPRDARAPLLIGPEHPGYPALTELGWATPESLHRRRPAPGAAALRRFLHHHALGLLIATPQGARTPSLLVALGLKNNRGPYTFPEIERLISLTEIIDNTLARSRLTTQAALQAKTEHLAMMSRGLAHDLKNLITPIDSFLVHTERQIRPGTPEAEVHGAATRSVRIIADYVGEALFFANRLKPRFEPVDIEVLFSAVRDVTGIRVAERSVHLAFEAEPVPGFVADQILLQRLLANLVNNAIDAGSAGATVTIRVRAGCPARVRLEVEDHGCGIPDANLRRVFDPYFTTKEFGEDTRGFGLGLTICQKIVALHEGTISIQSQVGIGTTVVADVPLTPSPAAAGNVASTETRAAAGPPASAEAPQPAR